MTKQITSLVDLTNNTIKLLKGDKTIYKGKVDVTNSENLLNYKEDYVFDLSQIVEGDGYDLNVILNQDSVDRIEEAIYNSVFAWEKYEFGFTIIPVNILLFQVEATLDYQTNAPYDA